ncbi:MAG TPA: SAM hydroxide adenosyltransferase, partial [Verrucomicrobiae bacterium]|nr:SAM hydroxide adenosyltransferase [Verrucomicrobiae bacterium]
VAAHLSRGVPPARLGRKVTDWIRLPWPEPVRSRNAARGEVLYVDRFGNAITNIEPEPGLSGPGMIGEVVGRRKVRCPVAEFYGAVPVNRPVAVFGSSGFLEIAVNGGSAAREFGIRAGAGVVLRRVR